MKHLLLFAVVGVGVLLAVVLFQRRPSVAAVPVNPVQDAILGIGDGALGIDRNLDTGSGWYEYWRGTMSAIAARVGAMDPSGTATPTPTSP